MATKWIVEAVTNGENANGPRRCCGHEHRSYAAAVKCQVKHPGMTIVRYVNNRRVSQAKESIGLTLMERFQQDTAENVEALKRIRFLVSYGQLAGDDITEITELCDQVIANLSGNPTKQSLAAAVRSNDMGA